MEIWYAIPSASPERAAKCLARWRDQGYLTAVLIDTGQPRPEADLVLEEALWPGYYRSVNQLVRAIGNADIVVAGGDDLYPDPTRDAEELGLAFFRRFSDGFGVMQPTGDDLDGTDRICGSPWFGAGWIARAYQGEGPFFPGYDVFFGDEELKNVTERLGVLWQRRDVVQYHDHWIRPGGPPKTDYQTRNDRFWAGDKALFASRQAAGFPGHEPRGA